MGARKKNELDPDQPGDLAPGTLEDAASYEAAKASGKLVELAPRVAALPDRAIRLHAKRAFLGSAHDPVVSSFLHMEQLSGKTRKLTRDEWLAELDRFKKAPR